MKKRLVFVLGALALALVASAVGLTLGAHWDMAGWQYPGAVPFEVESAQIATVLGGRVLSREDVYRTNAEYIPVLKWYKAKLEAIPAGEVRVFPAGECVMLATTRRLLWIKRVFAVFLCADPESGTRISVNDMVTFER